MSSPAMLLTLPSELIEAILICSRSPCTVASFAQTCRTLRTLVYASPDSHLWRELFLTTWDDPRPALEHRAVIDPRINPTNFDWATEYRRRVTADKRLKAWRRDVCLADDPDTSKDPLNANPEWRTDALSALSAVLDTVLTLQPFPVAPPIALRVLSAATALNSESSYPTGNAESGVGERRERMTSAPPLPPLLIVLASGVSAFHESRSGLRVGRTVYGPHASRVNINVNVHADDDSGLGRDSGTPGTERTPTTIRLPTPSLPPQLVRTLLASCTIRVRGLPTYTPFLSGAGIWGGDLLGDVFHRIVCMTGFVPIPPPVGPASAATNVTDTLAESPSDRVGSTSAEMETLKDWDSAEEDSELGTQDGGEEEEHDELPVRRVPKPFPTPLQQHKDARILARRRVYDMQYLRGDRMWGPFQVVTRVPRDARRSRLGDDGKRRSREEKKRANMRDVRRLGTLAWAIGADIDPDEFDSDSTSDDSQDEDWHDPEDRVQSAAGQDSADADTDADMEQVEPEHPLISLILASTDAADTADIDPITGTSMTTPTTSRRRTRRSNPRLPPDHLVFPREIKSHHLRPDYVYLASARIVVEANLKELFGSEISDHVERPEPEMRAGGVGMFWEDEDAILRARAGSTSEQALSSPATPPSGVSTTASTKSSTLELSDILLRFHSLETARLGSSCGYWSGWSKRYRSTKRNVDGDPDVFASSSVGDIKPRRTMNVADRAQLEKSEPIQSVPKTKDKGKGKEKYGNSATVPGLGSWELGPEDEPCEGWDWAGVSGIWRRCVCWMDYRELLFFNLDSSKFLTLDTQEACRIIPMELRITGYTRAGLMPIYDTDRRDNINVLVSRSIRSKMATCKGYFRPPPVIHFSGSSIGSDRGMDDGRKVRGSVQLIGGGEVRWRMDTYTQETTMPGSLTPEWASEAVQVGGLGSAIGLLGMWTGAGHERTDPLGPFWAWKVV